MLTRMRNALRMIGGKAHTSTMNMFPKLSGAELARSSWAMPVGSINDVPDVYKNFFDAILSEGRTFPYTVLTPSHERFIHRQSEKLISDLGGKIYVLERTGNSYSIQCYPVDGISYVEFRTALLASSMKICGRMIEGVHSSSTLIFNSVTDYLFKPFLESMRPVTPYAMAVGENSVIEQFHHLVRVNYKFMNFAKHSLLDGEKVILSILQPEVRENLFTVLGRNYQKTISPTHMSILTDRELILIQEETVRRKDDKYGGIWTYIPLQKILSISMRENTDLLVIEIQLPEDVCFELLFQVSAKGAIQQLLDWFRKFKNKG